MSRVRENRMHGSRWRGLETEHRLDKDAEVAHPTGKPTERRLRVLQPERATAPVPDPTDHAPGHGNGRLSLQERVIADRQACVQEPASSQIGALLSLVRVLVRLEI